MNRFYGTCCLRVPKINLLSVPDISNIVIGRSTETDDIMMPRADRTHIIF